MTTDNKTKKKKLSNEDISDLAELLVEAISGDENLDSASELISSATGAERIELFAKMRDYCRHKHIKLPSDRLEQIILHHPKLLAKTWPRYFDSILKTVGSTVEETKREESLFYVFNEALNYYRNAGKKGYASITSQQLSEFVLICPKGGLLLLKVLGKFQQAKDYTALDMLGIGFSAMFQEKSGVRKLDAEAAARVLEYLSGIPPVNIPKELFVILPALCVRCRQIPGVFAASEIAESLRIKKLYPVKTQTERKIITPREPARSESIATMLESVPALIRNLEKSNKERTFENKRLRKQQDDANHIISDLGRELSELKKKYRDKNSRLRELLQEKSSAVNELQSKLEVVEEDKEEWRKEHDLLEMHSAREQEHHQDHLLGELAEKLGGKVKNLRTIIGRVLDKKEISAGDVQSIAIAFNSVCKPYNKQFAKDGIEYLSKEKIIKYQIA